MRNAFVSFAGEQFIWEDAYTNSLNYLDENVRSLLSSFPFFFRSDSVRMNGIESKKFPFRCFQVYFIDCNHHIECLYVERNECIFTHSSAFNLWSRGLDALDAQNSLFISLLFHSYKLKLHLNCDCVLRMTYIEISTHVARRKMNHVHVRVTVRLDISQLFFINILSPKRNLTKQNEKKKKRLVSESHSAVDSGDFTSHSFVDGVTSFQIIIVLCSG